jgi:Tol biopolymer transport system component
MVSNVPVHSPSTEAVVQVVDLAIGGTTNVSEGLFAARAPAWSPDGSLMAFEACEDGPSDIYVCAADGSSRRRVTDTADAAETGPCFVGTGRVAWVAVAEAGQSVQLYSLTDATNLVLMPTRRRYQGLAASPDGRTLVVAGGDKVGGPVQLFAVSVEDGSARVLTPDAALYSTPSYSPDGRSIAFCYDGVDIDGVSRGLAVLSLTDGSMRSVAPEGYPFAPVSWFPDGRRIAYVSAPAYHNTWVQVANLDTGEATRLAVDWCHICGWPRVTPDGSTVVYQGVWGAKYSVHAYDLDTQTDRLSSPTGETAVTPAVAPTPGDRGTGE